MCVTRARIFIVSMSGNGLPCLPVVTATRPYFVIQWPFGRADYAHSHYASIMADVQITPKKLHRICHDKVTRSGSRHQATTKHNLQYRTVRVRLSTWQSARAIAVRVLVRLFLGQTTKVGRLAMADDKGGSPGKVGRPFVKFLQSKKYAYD